MPPLPSTLRSNENGNENEHANENVNDSDSARTIADADADAEHRRVERVIHRYADLWASATRPSADTNIEPRSERVIAPDASSAAPIVPIESLVASRASTAAVAGARNNHHALLRTLEELRDSLELRVAQLSASVRRLREQAGRLDREMESGGVRESAAFNADQGPTENPSGQESFTTSAIAAEVSSLNRPITSSEIHRLLERASTSLQRVTARASTAIATATSNSGSPAEQSSDQLAADADGAIDVDTDTLASLRAIRDSLQGNMAELTSVGEAHAEWRNRLRRSREVRGAAGRMQVGEKEARERLREIEVEAMLRKRGAERRAKRAARGQAAGGDGAVGMGMAPTNLRATQRHPEPVVVRSKPPSPEVEPATLPGAEVEADTEADAHDDAIMDGPHRTRNPRFYPVLNRAEVRRSQILDNPTPLLQSEIDALDYTLPPAIFNDHLRQLELRMTVARGLPSPDPYFERDRRSAYAREPGSPQSDESDEDLRSLSPSPPLPRRPGPTVGARGPRRSAESLGNGDGNGNNGLTWRGEDVASRMARSTSASARSASPDRVTRRGEPIVVSMLVSDRVIRRGESINVSMPAVTPAADLIQPPGRPRVPAAVRRAQERVREERAREAAAAAEGATNASMQAGQPSIVGTGVDIDSEVSEARRLRARAYRQYQRIALQNRPVLGAAGADRAETPSDAMRASEARARDELVVAQARESRALRMLEMSGRDRVVPVPDRAGAPLGSGELEGQTGPGFRAMRLALEAEGRARVHILDRDGQWRVGPRLGPTFPMDLGEEMMDGVIVLDVDDSSATRVAPGRVGDGPRGEQPVDVDELVRMEQLRGINPEQYPPEALPRSPPRRRATLRRGVRGDDARDGFQAGNDSAPTAAVAIPRPGQPDDRSVLRTAPPAAFVDHSVTAHREREREQVPRIGSDGEGRRRPGGLQLGSRPRQRVDEDYLDPTYGAVDGAGAGVSPSSPITMDGSLGRDGVLVVSVSSSLSETAAAAAGREGRADRDGPSGVGGMPASPGPSRTSMSGSHDAAEMWPRFGSRRHELPGRAAQSPAAVAEEEHGERVRLRARANRRMVLHVSEEDMETGHSVTGPGMGGRGQLGTAGSASGMSSGGVTEGSDDVTVTSSSEGSESDEDEDDDEDDDDDEEDGESGSEAGVGSGDGSESESEVTESDVSEGSWASGMGATGTVGTAGAGADVVSAPIGSVPLPNPSRASSAALASGQAGDGHDSGRPTLLATRQDENIPDAAAVDGAAPLRREAGTMGADIWPGASALVRAGMGGRGRAYVSLLDL